MKRVYNNDDNNDEEYNNNNEISWSYKISLIERKIQSWECVRCGNIMDDENVYLLECNICNWQRFDNQPFQGNGFFVTRTLIDHEGMGPSTLHRISWHQLLQPPHSNETLLGVMVSGLVMKRSITEKWALSGAWPRDCKCWAVLHRNDISRDPAQVDYFHNFGGVSNWRCIQWSPKAIGSMHIKLYLFRFSNTLRVCISSANPSAANWNYQREVVWVQDFPRVVDATAATPVTEFGSYLGEVLSLMRVTKDLLSMMDLPHVDFSSASGHLVASIPGVWDRTTNFDAYGHLRLRKIIRESKWKQEHNATCNTYIQTSSLGHDLSPGGFFDDFLASVDGVVGSNGPVEVDEDSHEDLLAPRVAQSYPRGLKIFFPSTSMAARSRQAYSKNQIEFEGSITSSVRMWDNAYFPVDCIHDVWPPGSAAVPSPAPFAHSKIIFRFVDDSVSPDPECLGWLYIGSHNLSKNAWGCRSPFLHIPSMELGVVQFIYDRQTLNLWKSWLPFNVDAPLYREGDTPYSTPVFSSLPRMIDRLVESGFDEQNVESAVLGTNGDVNKAIDLIVMENKMK